MRGPKVASYCKRGYTMSKRARISHKNNEHPITHWIKILALDNEVIKKMLIHIGVHHTGLYAKRTEFYRLPRLDNFGELNRFYKEFHSIPATKKKCIKYFADYFQKEVQASNPKLIKPKRVSPSAYQK